MNWEAIGAVGEILGAIAVVVSLLYLAIQIRQSNRLAIRESRMSFITQANEFHKVAIENTEHASLRVKLRDPNPKLTREERQQAIAFTMMISTQWANASISYAAGFLPDAMVEKYVRWVSSSFKAWPGIAIFVEKGVLAQLDSTEASNPIYSKVREELERIKREIET